MNEPLGPVSIEFDATANGAAEAVVIDETLEDQDTLLATNSEIFGVKMDQLPGYYIAQHVDSDEGATFACSILINKAMLPNLSNEWEKHETGNGVAYNPAGKKVLFGTLKIHPLTAGIDVDHDYFGKKVMCTVNVQANFKKRDLVRADLLFNFAGNPNKDDDDYRALFTIGDFTSP